MNRVDFGDGLLIAPGYVNRLEEKPAQPTQTLIPKVIQVPSQPLIKQTTPGPQLQKHRVDFGDGISIAPGYGLQYPEEKPNKPSFTIQVDNKVPLESIQIPKTEPSPLPLSNTQGFEIPSLDDEEG